MHSGSIRVGIIGTGLIGGSLAIAFRKNAEVGAVIGYDQSQETRVKAEGLAVLDEVADSPAGAVEGCDFVFLATPVGVLVRVFDEVKESLKRGAVVTDVGSTKLKVTQAIENRVPPGCYYVGGHPMAGSEQSGIESARGDLFRDAYYILTPTGKTDTEAFRRLHRVLTTIGARVISMDPESHDRAMATVSHVPHLLSLLLMGMAGRHQEKARNLFTVAAGGFRDMTRIAASSPEMWTDICMENRAFIVERLLEYASDVHQLVGTLEGEDRVRLRELFEEAKRSRVELSLKAGRELEDLFEVSVPVPDEPGVISNVSTAVGSVGINIEDIGIVHPLEGEVGILKLKILGEENARRAAEQLESAGFAVSMRRS